MSNIIYTDQKHKAQREYHRKWQKEHPEKVRASNIKWRKEHPEQNRQNRASIAKWKKEHPEKNKAHWAKWKNEHPIELQVNNINCTCKRLGIPGRINSQEWKLLLFLSFNCCLCCGKSSTEVGTLHIDHIIPKHLKNGKVNPKCTNNIDNVQPLCVFCNCVKNIKTTDYRLI